MAGRRSILLGLAGLALQGCRARGRPSPSAAASSAPSPAAPAPSPRSSVPEVYPPPEYVTKGPPLVRREHPSEADIPDAPLAGSTEGYRFEAKAVVLESKQTGWNLAVYARDIARGEWFPPTRAPQFNLSIGAVPLGKGTVVRGPLAQTPKLWFQTISPTLGVLSFASPSSYCVAIDEWEAEPFRGSWMEAGLATLRIYLYVAPHNCLGGNCFAGAQIAGVFKGARIRYFLAPP